MKVIRDATLKDFTTVHIGGVAKEMLFPESVEELVPVSDCPYIISGGSNLLISNRCFDRVVNMKYVNTTIQHLGGGHYNVGSSVHLQQLIKATNKDGYGGIEYLFPVPGLVGGAVAMNAGMSQKTNKNISDFIISVDVIENGIVKKLTKEECEFAFRQSIFKHSCKKLIVSVEFQFRSIDKDYANQIIKQQIEFRNKTQDKSKPNFGSVFCVCDHNIMAIVRRLSLGKNAHFSRKTPNWLLNDGGDYADAIKAIKTVERMHKLMHKPCVREVVVWE